MNSWCSLDLLCGETEPTLLGWGIVGIVLAVSAYWLFYSYVSLLCWFAELPDPRPPLPPPDPLTPSRRDIVLIEHDPASDPFEDQLAKADASAEFEYSERH